MGAQSAYLGFTYMPIWVPNQCYLDTPLAYLGFTLAYLGVQLANLGFTCLYLVALSIYLRLRCAYLGRAEKYIFCFCEQCFWTNYFLRKC